MADAFFSDLPPWTLVSADGAVSHPLGRHEGQFTPVPFPKDRLRAPHQIQGRGPAVVSHDQSWRCAFNGHALAPERVGPTATLDEMAGLLERRGLGGNAALKQLRTLQQAAADAGDQEDLEARAQQAEEELRRLALSQFSPAQLERQRRDLERGDRHEQPEVTTPRLSIDRRYATEDERLKAEVDPNKTAERLKDLEFNFSWK